jgi:ribonuclease P protein component
MTPPKASLYSDTACREMPSVGFSRPEPASKIEVIQKRADFLRASRAPRVAMPGFVIQIRPRNDDGPMRVGFTCSKKVGNAVARNRAKRRLREIARLVLPQHGADGTDYVLIGRNEKTDARDFQDLLADLCTALSKEQHHKVSSKRDAT